MVVGNGGDSGCWFVSRIREKARLCLFEDNFFCVVDRRVVIWVAVEVRVVDIGVGGSAG